MNLGVVLPGIIGAPLLVYGIFYHPLRRWMQKGFGRLVKIVFYAGYAIFLALFILCSVIMFANNKSVPDQKADAVIILGGGIKGDVATITVKSRMDTALPYLKAHPDCLVVVSGGQGPGEIVSEASVMAAYLERNGIEERRIVQEDQSTSTYENLTYSKAKLDKLLQKPYSVIIVTNGFHMYRAKYTAKIAGLSAQGLASPGAWYLIPNNFLRETVGIVKTWVLGPE
jgi:uncharacterized SAM-binding protein YcdF (DUF218 family)